MDMDTEEEIHQRIDGLEAENHYLTNQIKQLENALDKEKKFHRKFVEVALQSEEIINHDFDKERKELVGDRKRLTAENRQLAKDKSFYQTAYDSLMKEEDTNSSSKNVSQSISISNRRHNTRLSSSISEGTTSSNCSTPKSLVSSPTQIRHRNSKVTSKASAKLFEDNKRLKLKTTKLTRDNASLRLKLKQLENLINKIQTKKLQHVADQNELQNLFESTRRTNHQIFNPEILFKLGQLSRD